MQSPVVINPAICLIHKNWAAIFIYDLHNDGLVVLDRIAGSLVVINKKPLLSCSRFLIALLLKGHQSLYFKG